MKYGGGVGNGTSKSNFQDKDLYKIGPKTYVNAFPDNETYKSEINHWKKALLIIPDGTENNAYLETLE